MRNERTARALARGRSTCTLHPNRGAATQRRQRRDAFSETRNKWPYFLTVSFFQHMLCCCVRSAHMITRINPPLVPHHDESVIEWPQSATKQSRRPDCCSRYRCHGRLQRSRDQDVLIFGQTARRAGGSGSTWFATPEVARWIGQRLSLHHAWPSGQRFDKLSRQW